MPPVDLSFIIGVTSRLFGSGQPQTEIKQIDDKIIITHSYPDKRMISYEAVAEKFNITLTFANSVFTGLKYDKWKKSLEYELEQNAGRNIRIDDEKGNDTTTIAIQL